MIIFLQILYVALGFFLSINQGISLIVGHLRNGMIIGADVFMPVDIPLYLLFLLSHDRSKETKVWLPVFIVKLLIIVFYLLAFTGEFIAYDVGEFRFQLVHLTRGILIFYVIASRLHEKRYLKNFVIGLLLGLGVQSLIGFWQWQIGPVTLPYFKITSGFRVTGLLAVPNAFGAYLVTLLPLVIRVIFFTDIKPKILWIIIAMWSIGSLYATYTRGAWLAFVGVMIVFSIRDLWTRKINQQRKLIFVTLGMIFIMFMSVKYGNNIIHRMQGSSEALSSNATQSRSSLAKDALRIINENKAFGVGLNNYRHFADQRTLGLKMVHNVYLLIAAEQGIFSAVVFVIAHIIVLVLGVRLLFSRDKLIYNIGAATLAGYVGLLIYHNVSPDYRMVGVLMQHWRLLGMIPALVIMDEITTKQRNALLIRMNQNKLRMKSTNLEPGNGKSLVPDSPDSMNSGNIQISQ